MSAKFAFNLLGNAQSEVETNRRDQSLTNLEYLCTHSGSEFGQASYSVKELPDSRGARSMNGRLLQNGELTEQTALEHGLYLLPASIASFLLRQSKFGSFPSPPILRVLGLVVEERREVCYLFRPTKS